MDCISTRLPYRKTGAFSKIPLDYIDQAPGLSPFFANPATKEGVQQAIQQRKNYHTASARTILVEELKAQYATVTTSRETTDNIASLLSPDTFTITTAHQNNIFTGPLYFIYKIIHAIKLADDLNKLFPQQHFVPVYYIGSEDADLEELSHIVVDGEKLVWNTNQTGAVGRMKIDKTMVALIERIEGQIGVLPHGAEMVQLFRRFYAEGVTIQDATFGFVNGLFGAYGLIVLLPDNAVLKKQAAAIFKDDLLHQSAAGIIDTTAARLNEAGYKTQANPREINLFYLEGAIRERIEKERDVYRVVNTNIEFTQEALLSTLEQHPERFSPNVILRGLYQESILPNIIFIGGGGETAYWLQLKPLFEFYKVPFPILVLRNSFLIIEKKYQQRIAQLGLNTEDMFLPESALMNKIVARESEHETKLNGSLTQVEQLYEDFKKQASAVDTTLEKHVDALKSKAIYRLQQLEKKMLRAEKRKFTDQQRQLHSIKEHLFPGEGLQERKENLAWYYAKWGRDFIHQLYQHSLGLEQEFVVLTEV